MVTEASLIPQHPWTRTRGMVTQTDENTHEASRCTDERMDMHAHSYTHPDISNRLETLKENHGDPLPIDPEMYTTKYRQTCK